MREVEKHNEVSFAADMGVKAGNLKDRSIQTCLNCKRPVCTCCPKSEKEDKR